MNVALALRKNRDNLFSFGATLCRACTRFLLVFLASFLLTKYEFGLFNIFLSLYFFARLFSENSLNLPFIKFASDGEYSTSLVNFQAIVLKISYVVLVSGIIFLCNPWLVEWSGIERRSLLLLISPLLLSLTLYMFIGQVLISGVHMRMLLFYEFITLCIFGFFLTVWYLIGSGFSTDNLILLFGLTLMTSSLIGYFCFRSLITFTPTIDKELLWKLIHYSKFTILSGISSLVILKADVLMLGYFRNPREVGVYGMALFVNEAVQMVFDSVLRVCLPKASALSNKGSNRELRQLFTSSVQNIYFGILPIIIVIGLGAPGVIHFVYQGRYDDSVSLVYLFLFSSLVKPVGYVSGIILGATGHIRLDNRNCWISALLNIFCNFLLIPRYGVTGAAVASMLSFISLTVLHYLSVQKAVFRQVES